MQIASPTPDFKPLYVQIKELLMRRLASSHWKPGELLPSEPKLAAEFGVSQGTVRKALEELAAQNLVVRQQGKGTFVATHTADRALFHFFHLVGEDGARELPESRVIECQSGPASRDERERLQLAARAKVLRIRRVRALAGEPVISERICLAAAQFPRLDGASCRELPNTLYEFYEREYGIVIAKAVERLRAVAAAEEDAGLLGIAPGTPLLEIDRLALGHEDRPVEWRVSRCDTRRHHYYNQLD